MLYTVLLWLGGPFLRSRDLPVIVDGSDPLRYLGGVRVGHVLRGFVQGTMYKGSGPTPQSVVTWSYNV